MRSQACKVCVMRECRMYIGRGEVRGLKERVAFLRDLGCRLLRSRRVVSMH